MISQSEEPGEVSLQRISLFGANAPLIAVSEKPGLKKKKKINQLTTRLWIRPYLKNVSVEGQSLIVAPRKLDILDASFNMDPWF